MKVKNINGPENYYYPKGCKSWIEFWEKKKKPIQLVINCPACNTTIRQDKVEAAHVHKAEGKDNAEYIVPVCEHCSTRDSIYSVKDSLLLAVPE
ncbi:hypothetical protein Bcop_1228 [Bacteroides coprosuis DSM 18011]|uniref:Uncharacterized protein n=1 Tax=Bacteroides coprosuis DSM 18011 TaxID=679937 RepID=F3ZUX2_9BACE|nr:hypothetical protein [Bacteroides coprosuis]EGJ71432.1 hypothetical protein Bcop_1228 [Bacteroides coprosuis DSM 18011]